MYCWGNNSDGQLGIADGDKIVNRPQLCRQTNLPLWVSCGWKHSVFLARDGTVKTCGSNGHGQLGREGQGKNPEVVSALETHNVSQVVCGHNHTAAVSDQGLVFTWGSNSNGQLGLGSNAGPSMNRPKIVKQLTRMTIVQLACGTNHCIAMSRGGHLFTWGDNSHGQLGIGTLEDQYEPCLISSLQGVPFSLINAGGHHTFALTMSGALFGWGRNNFGQLGVHDFNDRVMPTLLRSLRSQHVVYVACGENHTAILTVDGGVFTFGCGESGQLGHNTNVNEVTPKRVFDLMGSVVTQIACGRSFTLAFISSSNKVYSFGQGGNGQLGINSTSNSNTCLPVNGPWNQSSEGISYKVSKLIAGGDHCFVVATEDTDAVDSPEKWKLHVNPQLTLTGQFTEDLVKRASLSTDTRDIFEILETVFSSQACLNGSFYDSKLTEGISSRVHGIDLAALTKSFLLLGAIPNDNLKRMILSSIADHLLPSMMQQQPPDIEALRVYLMLPELDMIITRRCHTNIVIPFAKCILRLKHEALRVLGRWWSTLTAKYFQNVIKMFQGSVRYLIGLSSHATMNEIEYQKSALVACMEVLSQLNKANSGIQEIVPFKQFYVPEIQENIDIRADYFNWIQDEVQTMVQ